jgi:hypothetical protein
MMGSEYQNPGTDPFVTPLLTTLRKVDASEWEEEGLKT